MQPTELNTAALKKLMCREESNKGCRVTTKKSTHSLLFTGLCVPYPRAGGQKPILKMWEGANDQFSSCGSGGMTSFEAAGGGGGGVCVCVVVVVGVVVVVVVGGVSETVKCYFLQF